VDIESDIVGRVLRSSLEDIGVDIVLSDSSQEEGESNNV
jgi:hypothetical protein